MADRVVGYFRKYVYRGSRGVSASSKYLRLPFAAGRERLYLVVSGGSLALVDSPGEGEYVVSELKRMRGGASIFHVDADFERALFGGPAEPGLYLIMFSVGSDNGRLIARVEGVERVGAERWTRHRS